MIYVFLKILMWEFYELKLQIAVHCKIIFVTLVLLKMPGSYPRHGNILFMSIHVVNQKRNEFESKQIL